MGYRTTSQSMTFADLVGENAFVVLGTMKNLLQQLERAIPETKGIVDTYTAEAQDNDYDHLLRVSHRYARRYLASTLSVAADFDAAYTTGDYED